MWAQPHTAGLHLDPAAEITAVDAASCVAQADDGREAVNEPSPVAVIGGPVDRLVDDECERDRCEPDRKNTQHETRKNIERASDESGANRHSPTDKGDPKHAR